MRHGIHAIVPSFGTKSVDPVITVIFLRQEPEDVFFPTKISEPHNEAVAGALTVGTLSRQDEGLIVSFQAMNGVRIRFLSPTTFTRRNIE